MAFAIAVVVVFLSGSGIGSMEVLLLPSLFILPLVVLSTVIKLAVDSAIREASKEGDDVFEGTARGKIGHDEYRRWIRELQAG